MLKFIRYHLLYLFNDLWILLAIIMMTVSSVLFFYMGNGFDSEVLRILEKKSYLIDFQNEAFLICNIILSIWIIGASKEIFVLEEPEILLINKPKYIKSKVLAYLIYYLFISLLLYGVYQIIVVSLYGIVKFNYIFIINLLINVSLTHLIVVLGSGNNKNILLTMIFIVIYLITNILQKTDFPFVNYFNFFIPILNLDYPTFGYLHEFLIMFLIYFIATHKHITYYP